MNTILRFETFRIATREIYKNIKQFTKRSFRTSFQTINGVNFYTFSFILFKIKYNTYWAGANYDIFGDNNMLG
jgi:hypothetical protein